METRRISWMCEYFGLLFVSFCAPEEPNKVQKRTLEEFQMVNQWTHLNFSWPSESDYAQSILTRRYIPENNIIGGVKFYKDNVYLALPRMRHGTPVTLAYIPRSVRQTTNAILTPFPSWNMNVQANCATLQNVQSMEIDRRGIMWVLDGNTMNSLSKCPPKIVLLDLNNGGKVIQSYFFKSEVCLSKGGYLNDLVIDEGDGGYAYITDNSAIDPGLIVYSRQQGRAWKLRDRSMFPEIETSNYTLDGFRMTILSGINGVALSPVPKTRDEDRLVYYTSLTGHNLHALNNRILKNEAFSNTDQWRRYVKFVGSKPSPSDGLIIDNQGNMYFGLIGAYGIGKWNIYQPFLSTKDSDYRPNDMIWPSSFGIDNSGFVYVLTNDYYKFLNPSFVPSLTNHIKFKLFKLFTGTRNYMYTGN